VTIIIEGPGRGDQSVAGGLRADWAGQGRCASSDPDALFVRGAAQQGAKVVCQRCPVIAECLADALDNRTEFGVWGGMTERERRALLRRRPNVTSWRRLLETAMADFEAGHRDTKPAAVAS
jgi:WhiB family transcriptional regulator, redox-sensing transcriptional regulator